MMEIIKQILKRIFYLMPNRIKIILINHHHFTVIRFILKCFGYGDLIARLNKNGLKILEIRYMAISNLFILRNVKCEMIKSNDASLVPFIEDYKKKNGDLNILNSFHYKLFQSLNKIKNIKKDMKNYDYYYWHKNLHQMNINYRDENWIVNKVLSCKRLFDSLKKFGFKKYNLLNYPIILNEPLIQSRYKINYNIDGHEIFDGHHRVSCAKALGYAGIPCLICKDIAIETPFGIKLNDIAK